MIFSYSPFDNFILPGENGDADLVLWAKNIEERTGRFVFCGLRDVKAEAELLIEARKHNQTEQISFRTGNIRLKEQSALAKESKEAYKIIENEISKQKSGMNVFDP